MVLQYTKDHLQCIICMPPDWPDYDTTQMILGVLAHRQRVSSSPVRADEMLPPGYVRFLLSNPPVPHKLDRKLPNIQK